MDFQGLIPAARALVGWSQTDLAGRVGMTQASIAVIERGRGDPHKSTLEKIRIAFERSGVEFLPTGVQLRRTPVFFIEGDTWYTSLLDDVSATLPSGGEVLIENVDDRKSSPLVIEHLRQMRRNGITFRMTAMEGNTHLSAPASWYRFIPAQYFKNWIVMVYGDKVAYSVADETGCMVITDANLADAMRNRFNMLWNVFPELKIESTAVERI